MNNLNLDKYLNIVNEKKVQKGLDTYIPLYPMLRNEGGKLCIGILLTAEKDDVWDISGEVKPEYWILIDINSENVLEFNKTSEKDFTVGKMIPKNIDNNQKEISKYIVEKTLQYKNYLIEDIKNEQLPLQKKLSQILGNELEIDGEKVNINDYLLSNLEEDIKAKVDELVNVLIWSKYGSITFYYDKLFNEILIEYKDNNAINKDKMKLCVEIMNNYYAGVVGIENIFNI
ncbi:MAG: hypothetical protein RR201_03055 [Malacoplasma sp.]